MQLEQQITINTIIDRTLRVSALYEESYSEGFRSSSFSAFQRSFEDEEIRYNINLQQLITIRSLNLRITGTIDAVEHSEEGTTLHLLQFTNEAIHDFDAELAITAWAKAKLLSALYCESEAVPQVRYSIHWYGRRFVQPIVRTEVIQRADAKAYLTELLQQYLLWSKPLTSWPAIRDISIEALPFPFEGFRPGQEQMIEAVQQSIKAEADILIQAPTGIGKTLASLYPAIKTMITEHIKKVFYLTARNTGKDVSFSAVQLLKSRGLRARTVIITSKESTCARKEAIKECEDCTYAAQYYKKLREAIPALVKQDDIYTRTIIEAAGEEFQICPFELSLDLATYADIIICDYNYVFDPNVKLKRFFTDCDEEYVFLVDEAHNLIDRGRNMYSATINLQAFIVLKKLIAFDSTDLTEALNNVILELNGYQSQIQTTGDDLLAQLPPYGLLKLLRKVASFAEEIFARKQKKRYKKSLGELYFAVRHFLNISEQYDEHYYTIVQDMGSDLTVQLFCINPASNLHKGFALAHSAIVFSATLSPPDYFIEVCGLSKQTKRLLLPSPFPREHFLQMVTPNLSTRYTHRQLSESEVVGAIESYINHQKGNFILFFPSYEYMNRIATLFIKKNYTIDTVVQQPEMSQIERELFLSYFDTERETTLVAFAVMGGIFGEGVDLVGERLHGVAIIGVGLPGISSERELIKNYFDKKKKGYDYSYTYPGLNKVLQAAGRVIRSSSDRGTLLLIDERFTSAKYRHLLPSYWSPVNVTNSADIARLLTDFYSQNQ